MKHNTLAGVLSFGMASLVVYGLTMMWLPIAVAAPDTHLEPSNVQVTPLLAYEGGSALFQGTPFPDMIVVSDNAIQPDLAIFDLNDSGFIDDAPEVNPIRKATVVDVRQPFKHIVSPGETLSGIANRYGIKLDTVLGANELTTKSTLRAGKVLTILPVDGVTHKVKSGETLSGIASKYKASSSEIAEYNNIVPSKLSVGTELMIPGGTPVITSPKVQQRGSIRAGSKTIKAGQVIDGIQMPTDAIISQGRGETDYAVQSGIYRGNDHSGVDMANVTGTPIYAAHRGTVIVAATQNGYGKVVYLKGQDLKGRTVFTRYGHLDSYNVTKGQVVEIGEQIGRMGSTGRSSGPHLHFEIRDSQNRQFDSHEFYQMFWGY